MSDREPRREPDATSRDFDASPRVPAHRRDTRDFVVLNGRLVEAEYEITGRNESIWAVCGSPAGLDEVIAFALDGFHTDAETRVVDELTIWRGRRVAAVLRGMPCGRREVIVLDGPEIERRTYPPHEEYAEHRREAL